MQKNIQEIQGIILIISSQIVISARNPIQRIVGLIIVYIGGSQIYMIQDQNFQGQTNIIVYVGAIAIQFIFVIMIVRIPNEISTQEKKDSEINIQKTGNKGSSRIKKIDIRKEGGTKKDKRIQLIFKENMENAEGSDFMGGPNKGRKKDILSNMKGVIGISQFIIQIYQQTRTIIEDERIYTYIYTTWGIEYKTMRDIETLGYIIYIVNPIIQIQIGIILWIVLIGVISICM